MNSLDLLIVHITDLHLKDQIAYSNKKAKSIAAIINKSDRSTVLLALTGDLASSGKKSEYKAFAKFLENIKSSICQSKTVHIAMVPGNHDRCFADGEGLTRKEELSTNADNFAEKLQEKIPLFSPFETLKKQFVSGVTHHNELLDEIHIRIDDSIVSVFMLNNSAFVTCRDDDPELRYDNKEAGNTFIPEEYLKPIGKADGNLSIVCMHLPICFYDDATKETFLKCLSQKQSLVLSGHIHEQHAIIDKSRSSGALEFVGSHFEDWNGANSMFSIIDLMTCEATTYTFVESCYSPADPISFDFLGAFSNSLGLRLNLEFKKSLDQIKVFSSTFEKDDVFVFPFLCRDRQYKESPKNIESLDGFEKIVSSKRFTIIEGEEGLGKTVLSHVAFEKAFVLGRFPVLINGLMLDGDKKIEKILKQAVLEQYSNEDAWPLFEQTNKESITLIVDDFPFNLSIAQKLAAFSDNIIMFGQRLADDLFNTTQTINGIRVERFELMPMYVDKRKELIGKVFEALRKEKEQPLAKDGFVSLVEEMLSKMDKFNAIDPETVSYLAIKAFENPGDVASGVYDSVFQAKIDLLLTGLIKKKRLNVDLVTVKRVTAKMALRLYRSQRMTFSLTDLRAIIEEEDKVFYGYSVKENSLVSLLVEARILKIQEAGEYQFFNRDIFAFFVAHCCSKEFFENQKEDLSLGEVLRADIFVPLNFLILMSVATQRGLDAIPVSITDYMFDLCDREEVLDEKELLDFSSLAGPIDRLKSLTRDDIAKIDRQRARAENKSRNWYLKNKDNFYFYEKVDNDIKEVSQWLYRLNICSVLLGEYSSSLRKPVKDKLLSCVVKLPKIILSKFHDTLFKELDEIYASIVSESKDAISSEIIERLQSFILDTKRAFMLMTFSRGAMSCKNANNFQLLNEKLAQVYSKNSPLLEVERLMVSSYSNDLDSFSTSAMKTLSNKSTSRFVYSCAFIISRNFIIRNYSYCIKSHRDLYHKIVIESKDTKMLELKR